MHSYEIGSAFQKAGQAFAKNAVPLILIALVGGVLSFIPQYFMTQSLVGDLGLENFEERMELRNEGLEDSVEDFADLLTTDPSTVTEEDVKNSLGGILEGVGADADKVFELAERAENGEEISGFESMNALIGNPFGRGSVDGSSSFGFGKIAFLGLLSFIIGLFVQSAMVKSSLDAVMGRKISMESIKESFKKIPTLILFGLVMMIISLINIIPLLGAIIFIIITLMVIQAPYSIFEENKGAIEAMTRSKELMQGNKLKMFLTFILLGILNLIGAMLFGIGLLITMPYSATVMAQIFADLSKGAKA